MHRAPTTPASQRGLDSQVDLLKRAAAQLGDTGSQALLKEQMGERINHLLEVKYEGMALEDRLPAVRKALSSNSVGRSCWMRSSRWRQSSLKCSAKPGFGKNG